MQDTCASNDKSSARRRILFREASRALIGHPLHEWWYAHAHEIYEIFTKVSKSSRILCADVGMNQSAGMRRFLVTGIFVGFGILALTTEAAGTLQIVGKRIEVPGGSYLNIYARALSLLLKNKDFCFVNVHFPYAGEISGTGAFIAVQAICRTLRAGN
jgi:hypothetical protein